MTWQRIDENTYIDNTLVTCAEYQLFIDEMREQGSYYQPDHWKSYNLPVGQALEPILGVRHSDAIEFCDWLTKREDKKWKYRIPAFDENDQHPIHHFGRQLGGVWAMSEDENLRFAKLSSQTGNRRIFSQINIKQLANSIKFERENTHARNDLLPQAVFPRNELDKRINNHFLSLSVAHMVDRARALNFDQNIDKEIDRAVDRSQSRGVDIEYDIKLDKSLALSPDCAVTCSLIWDINLALDLFIDVLSFQERIAGRSPAFEGIRLVKERTK
jgi:hypothetical protein